jgi:uncharacterized protein YggE
VVVHLEVAAMSVSPRPVARRAALVAVALVVLAGCSKTADAETKPASSKEPDRTVTVTATGTSKGVPDALLVNLSVTTGGPSAADTLADNNRRTQKVLDQLKITAVDDEDVATTSVDLGPTYDEDGTITGYAATNSLRITFRSLDSAGAKLDALVKGGDNHVRVNGVQLGFTDDDELVSTARIDAVKRAKAQAGEMAGAAGAEVGKVRTIADVAPDDLYPQALAAAGRSSTTDSSVPIAAGSEELEVQVKVVFELT